MATETEELAVLVRDVRNLLARSPRPIKLGAEGEAALTRLMAGPPANPGGAEALAAVRAELGECRRCKLHAGRTKLVFGVGDPGARLMFIGEGPGRDEDLQGEPFVGRAGEMLTNAIRAMSLSREQVYIANVIKCRPPENRNPEPDEAAACLPYLEAQIAAIRPRVICLLGAVAAKYVLGEGQVAITKLRGRWLDYPSGGIRVMPTYHPAYLLRNPHAKPDFWTDLKEICAYLGLTPRTGKAGSTR